ncbi:MAG TPA: PKD domain-containing protein, partial [Nocardioides sp.]|nr:PKD domain-containing protein [Nocardioides sp.]
TDFESSGGPDDPRVFNGGCRENLTTSQRCTLGWRYVAAGSEAAADHAYYLEMRDRSGFDLDGQGQIDRDPIGFAPGLSLVYTDEAHGYGNAGTDDPPAQSPLDSQPEPGESAPDLNDAAYTATDRDSSYTDSGIGHTDNYEDPGNSETDSRYPEVSNPWRFRYNCLAFNVLSMFGDTAGPATSDGDLTGDVAFRIGQGCGAFDYGYGATDTGVDEPATARFTVRPLKPTAGDKVVLSGAQTTDDRTDPTDLFYSWDFGNGGSREDATGQVARTVFKKAGPKLVTLTVTDRAGNSDTVTHRIRVRR